DVQAAFDLLFHPPLVPVPGEGDLLVDVGVTAVVERVIRRVPGVRGVRDQLVRLGVRADDLNDRLHAPGHVRADLHLRLEQDDVEGRDEGPRHVDRIVLEAVDHRLDVVRVARRVRGLAGARALDPYE